MHDKDGAERIDLHLPPDDVVRHIVERVRLLDASGDNQHVDVCVVQCLPHTAGCQHWQLCKLPSHVHSSRSCKLPRRCQCRGDRMLSVYARTSDARRCHAAHLIEHGHVAARDVESCGTESSCE